MDELIQKLQQMNEQAELGGGIERIKKMHAQGKLTARERIDKATGQGYFC